MVWRCSLVEYPDLNPAPLAGGGLVCEAFSAGGCRIDISCRGW